jgi:pimeloyl-ACP methyl ester carboxylesterase
MNEAPPDRDATFRDAVSAYDAAAEVGVWSGPHYRMTYRVLGAGPPLLLCPGIAATYRVYAVLLRHLAGRFRTVVFDYPGDVPGDGADLKRVTHADLVASVGGLLDGLGIGRALPVGLSFGSTVVLGLLAREPRRYPRAALQGAFAHRAIGPAERLALAVGRHVPGVLGNLPLRRPVLRWKSAAHFDRARPDGWAVYVEENGRTPIAAMAHRADLLARLDLRPGLGAIPAEVLVISSRDDRIVPPSCSAELCAALPRGTPYCADDLGHQPHFTHPERLASLIGDFLLPREADACAWRGPTRPG